DRLFAALGREDLARTDARCEELFSPLTSCEDDPRGAVYPALSAVAARYRERTDAFLEFLKTVDDASLSAINPSEAQRERFPTKGSLVAFLLQGHTMMHLGQLSAWRRVMGMGEAMARPAAPGSSVKSAA